MAHSDATCKCAPTISVDDIEVDRAAHLANAGAVVLDVREDEEWADGHILGAVHIPLAAVADADLSMFDDRQVVVICRSGNRSRKAAADLAARGVRVVNVADGMTAWAAAGLPVVTDAHQRGR